MKKNAINELVEAKKPKRSRFGKLDIFPRILCLLLALLLWLTVVNVSELQKSRDEGKNKAQTEQTV